MSKKKKSWQNLFKSSIVIFLGGVIMAEAIRFLIGGISQIHIGILFIAISLLILYTIFTLELLHRNIRDQLDKTKLISAWVYEPAKKNESFQKASDIVLSAKNSIMVFSQYTPDTPTIDFPEDRKTYFDAFEDVIKSQLENPTSIDFKYIRIIQSYGKLESEVTLTKELLGVDTQLYDHCKLVFDMWEKDPKINVKFLVSEHIPSVPSMMIIDDKFVLLALLTKKLGLKKGLEFGGALYIEDRTSEAVKEFKIIFERLCQDCSQVTKVT